MSKKGSNTQDQRDLSEALGLLANVKGGKGKELGSGLAKLQQGLDERLESFERRSQDYEQTRAAQELLGNVRKAREGEPISPVDISNLNSEARIDFEDAQQGLERLSSMRSGGNKGTEGGGSNPGSSDQFLNLPLADKTAIQTEQAEEIGVTPAPANIGTSGESSQPLASGEAPKVPEASGTQAPEQQNQLSHVSQDTQPATPSESVSGPYERFSKGSKVKFEGKEWEIRNLDDKGVFILTRPDDRNPKATVFRGASQDDLSRENFMDIDSGNNKRSEEAKEPPVQESEKIKTGGPQLSSEQKRNIDLYIEEIIKDYEQAVAEDSNQAADNPEDVLKDFEDFRKEIKKCETPNQVAKLLREFNNLFIGNKEEKEKIAEMAGLKIGVPIVGSTGTNAEVAREPAEQTGQVEQPGQVQTEQAEEIGVTPAPANIGTSGESSQPLAPDEAPKAPDASAVQVPASPNQPADTSQNIQQAPVKPATPPVQQAPVAPEDVLNFKNSEDWREFEELRTECAKAEADVKNASGLNAKKYSKEEYESRLRAFEALWIQYNKEKKWWIDRVKKDIASDSDIITPPEDSKNVDRTLFDEFVKGEIQEYKKILKENREKTWLDEAKSKFADKLSNRCIQGYLKLNKWARLGINTTLFVAGGYLLGTAAAGGTIFSAAAYGAGRLGRGAASILGGNIARMAVERYWTEEKVEEEAKKRENEIKESDLPIEVKSSKFTELEEWKEKEKRKIKMKKAAVTLGAGVGAGIFAGITEQATGISRAKNAVESKPSTGYIDNLNRVPRTGAFESKPQIRIGPENSGVPSATGHSDGIYKVEPVMAKVPDTLEPQGLKSQIDTPDQAAKAPEAAIEIDPSALKHAVEKGDSVWNLLKKNLNDLDEFKKLDSQQQNYVLLRLSNEVVEKPGDFIIRPPETTRWLEEIGKSKMNADLIYEKDTIDFSKLFDDKGKIGQIFNEAENRSFGNFKEAIVPEKTPEIVPENQPGVSRGEAEKMMAAQKQGAGQAREAVMGDEFKNTKTTGVPTESAMTMTEPTIPEQPMPKPEDFPAPKSAADVLREEIEKLKGRKAELGNAPKAPVIEKAFPSMSELALKTNVILRGGLDAVYGEKGFLGLGKVEGINSKGWAFMSKLPADRVYEYFTGDSVKSNLPPNILKELASSAKHQSMMQQMAHLVEETGVRPLNNENVSQFLMRLVEKVVKNQALNPKNVV